MWPVASKVVPEKKKASETGKDSADEFVAFMKRVQRGDARVLLASKVDGFVPRTQRVNLRIVFQPE
jgi:hypothetical protein